MADRNGSWRFDVAAMMDILKNEGPDYYLVWTLLLSDARREPGKVKTAAGTVEMQRGDVLISYRGLADRLGYGERRKDAVRRIVKKMCATDALQMRHQVRHHFSVVTINNYEAWALSDDGVAPPFARPMRDRCDSSYSKHVIAKKKSSSGSSSKEELLGLVKPSFDAPAVFAEVWADYPLKLGRADALKHFGATVKSPDDVPRIKEALRRYLADQATNPWRKTQHGSTWFNNWQDWEHYQPPMLLVKHSEEEYSGPDWDAIAGLK